MRIHSECLLHCPLSKSYHHNPHLVEVRLELLHFRVGKTAELERIGSQRNREPSIEATSQRSSKNHTSARNTSNLETARTGRSKSELGAAERLAAHVVVVLRDSVEGIGLAALVDAAAANGAADYAAKELGTGTEDTVAGEAFAVETLLGFGGGGEGHGEGDDDVGELHLDCVLVKDCLNLRS